MMRQYIKLLESLNEKTDRIDMSVPLFIRCLEWARETSTNDIDLHVFVENITAMDRPLESEDYDDLFSGIESLDDTKSD